MQREHVKDVLFVAVCWVVFLDMLNDELQYTNLFSCVIVSKLDIFEQGILLLFLLACQIQFKDPETRARQPVAQFSVANMTRVFRPSPENDNVTADVSYYTAFNLQIIYLKIKKTQNHNLFFYHVLLGIFFEMLAIELTKIPWNCELKMFQMMGEYSCYFFVVKREKRTKNSLKVYPFLFIFPLRALFAPK